MLAIYTPCDRSSSYLEIGFSSQKVTDLTPAGVDFRALRFPCLLSAVTMPSGGTSDLAPEMIHAAAKGEAYKSFVREDTVMPFMTMPDAIQAILRLMAAPVEKLGQLVYNIQAFSPSAGGLKAAITEHFPEARIEFAIDERRQAIVDSWPAAVDDSAARRDWGYQPEHDFEAAFDDYLVPGVRQRYNL